jgi:hypothetical protein
MLLSRDFWTADLCAERSLTRRKICISCQLYHHKIENILSKPKGELRNYAQMLANRLISSQSMGRGPQWEADSHTAGQEILSTFYRTPIVPYSCHKGPPLNHIMIQLHSFSTIIIPTRFKIKFSRPKVSQQHFHLISSLFHLGFPTNILFTSVLSRFMLHVLSFFRYMSSPSFELLRKYENICDIWRHDSLSSFKPVLSISYWTIREVTLIIKL